MLPWLETTVLIWFLFASCWSSQSFFSSFSMRLRWALYCVSIFIVLMSTPCSVFKNLKMSTCQRWKFEDFNTETRENVSLTKQNKTRHSSSVQHDHFSLTTYANVVFFLMVFTFKWIKRVLQEWKQVVKRETSFMNRNSLNDYWLWIRTVKIKKLSAMFI